MDTKRADKRIIAAKGEARRSRHWVGASLMVNLLMAIAIVMVLGKQQTILMNIHDGKNYVIGGQDAGSEYIREMASQFVAITVNVHPKNVDRQNEKFLRYTDPSYYGTLKNKLLLEAGKIKKESISQTFYEQEVVLNKKNDQQVLVTGIRKVFYGKQLVSNRQVRYQIQFAMRNGRLWISQFEELKEEVKAFKSVSN